MAIERWKQIYPATFRKLKEDGTLSSIEDNYTSEPSPQVIEKTYGKLVDPERKIYEKNVSATIHKFSAVRFERH